VLLVEAEGVCVAEDQRPLLTTIHEFPHDDLLVLNRLEDFVVLHALNSFFEVAEHDLDHIAPAAFEQAVDVEADAFDTHVAHHHLVGPLVYDGLEVDVVAVDLRAWECTSFACHLGK
jgi:hypothetical protein